MEQTNQDRILALLKEEYPLSSVQIAEKLELDIKKVIGANVRLKKKGKIVADGSSPSRYSINDGDVNRSEGGVQDKILALLKKTDALSSVDIADRLGLKSRQVFDANCRLKKKGLIIAVGSNPVCYTLKGEYNGSSFKSSFRKSKKTEDFFQFDKYVIMYLSKSSSIPKMLFNFEDEETLLGRYSELQNDADVVDIAIYKKAEIIQKLELKA